MKQQYKYKFSFVMPVYNVEKYLAETVESILAQTIGFKENCELIFVNDGSVDNSEAVCLRYKEKFPDNITYIKQQNAGPGAARNRGIAAAQGKYISMPDSDDKLSADAAQEAYNFLEKHYDEIDLVSIKWQFFEARTGGHPLNYKFTYDRVIDLTKEYNAIQGSAAPAFFKEQVFRKHTFDPAVGRYSEDARFMGEVLLDKQKYGVITKPTYYYRKRSDQTSSQDGNQTDKFWYMETPKRAVADLLQYASQKTGSVPKFIQFMAMYELKWRFKQSVQTTLTKDEEASYKATLDAILADIDDDVIMAQQQLNLVYKLYILGRKHGEDVLAHTTRKGTKFYYHGTNIYDLNADQPAVHIEMLETSKDTMTLEGYYTGILLKGEKLQFRSDGTVYDAERVERPQRQILFLGEVVSDQNCFKVNLPLEHNMSIEAFVGGAIDKLPYFMHRYSYLSESAIWAYRKSGKWLVSKKPMELAVHPYTPLRRALYELNYLALLAKRLKLRIFLQEFRKWRNHEIFGYRWALVPAKSAALNAITISYRLAYFTMRPFLRRPIWILSDRIMVADDSGEILFRFLQQQPDLPANVYFALSKKSTAYSQLAKYGKVLNYGSFKYKLYFLLSDKIISSEATDYVVNAFAGHAEDYVDLYSFDFVFLQHGIIKDDISTWLNRYNKNIKLFVTSVKPEYESIIHGNYGYGPDVVKLTGLPRYDNLRNDPKKKLIITPTWRENLAGYIDAKTGYRNYNPRFKQSDYFNFYQNLMHDKRLLATMQKHGYSGEFYLHPSFQNQIKDFSGNEVFTIMHMPYDYPKAKSEGSVLLTDFSSVAFDFAYLKKPVVYAQFDNNTFYKAHTSREGYFSYEDNGFGPVVYDYEGAITALIKQIESGGAMLPKYQKRVQEFFEYNDRDNCKRVLNAILALDENSSKPA